MLQKIESEVVCHINNKDQLFIDGKAAYEYLKNKYSIVSISAQGSQINIVLETVSNDTKWEKAYKDQFGEEPSFF